MILAYQFPLVLQMRAPRPVRVARQTPISGLVPAYYSSEFHGMLPRERAAELLLAAGEGAYLVRESQRAPGNYTLCICFDSKVLRGFLGQGLLQGIFPRSKSE